MIFTNRAVSPQGQLNLEDIQDWVKNRILYFAPVLVVLIPELMKLIPQGWQYGALIVWVLGGVLKLIQIIMQGPKK